MRHHPMVRAVRIRRQRDDGYVLATVAGMSFVVIATVTAIFTMALVNISSARRASGSAEGRSQAESLLDRTFAQNATSTEDLAAPNGLSFDGLNWFGQKANGTYDKCTPENDFSLASTCVHLAKSSVGTGANDYRVDVTVRTKCQSGTLETATGRVTDASGCVVTRYQQRLRKKQFFDYLSFTDSERPGSTLGGNSTTPRIPYNGYTSSSYDALNGPVRTNDQFAICSTNSGWPQFKKGLFAVTTGLSKPADSGCADTPSVSLKEDFYDTTTSATSVELMALPKTTSTLSSIGKALELSPAKLTLCPNGYVSGTLVGSCTSPTPYPSSGVLYVTVDDDDAVPEAERILAVTGKYGGKLTIATPGRIAIDGNLTRNDPSNDSKDVLGLIAGSDIIIRCTFGKTTIRTVTASDDGNINCDAPNGGTSRTIEAALLALNGSIFVDNWRTGTTPPTLNFVGAMASKNRGIFGAYIQATGETVRGYKKKFTFDIRLQNQQPPFFLEPTTAVWERLDLQEIPPCGTGGPEGAGCP